MTNKKQDMDTQPYIPRFRQPAQRPTAPPLRDMPTQMWQRPLPPDPSPEPVRRKDRLSLWLLTAVILAFLVVSILLATMGGLLLYQADWLAPGVTVGGIDVGGLTQAEAAAVLAADWQAQTISLMVDGSSVAVAPGDLGLTLDAAATAVLARQQGRTAASWGQFLQENGRFPVSPVWQYDQGQAVAGLTALAATMKKPPVEAHLFWEDGRWQAAPSQPGYELDVAESVAALERQAPLILANRTFQPVTRLVNPTLVDVSAVAAQANALAAAPLRIEAYDPVTDETFAWTLPPETWGAWLRLEAASEPFSWWLDELFLRDYGSMLAAEMGNGRFLAEDELKTAVTEAIAAQNPQVNLRVYHPAQAHVVQAGESLSSIGREYGIPYPWIEQANPGLEGLSPGQTITIPSPDVMLPLPPVAHKRIVISLGQQRAWVYENGALQWEWPVSTGIASSPTVPGVFQIQSHEPNAYAGNWDLWMPSFMGIYRPVPASDFMNGFHGFPTRGGSALLWTGDLGHPVTYGCILLSSENAQLLYEWAESGTIVAIEP